MVPVVVLPAALAAEIADRTREENECGGVILAGIARDGDGVRLLGREIYWVPGSAYDRRTPMALSVRSQGMSLLLHGPRNAAMFRCGSTRIRVKAPYRAEASTTSRLMWIFARRSGCDPGQTCTARSCSRRPASTSPSPG